MKRHFLPILLTVAISLATYSNTLKNGFVYDDETTIVNNDLIRDFRNLPFIFKKDYLIFASETSYRPVVTATYFLDYVLYGLNPWGYHLTNVLFHAGNTIMLYLFLTPLLRQLRIPNNVSYNPLLNSPLIVTIIFAAHPVLAEAVNAVSFREDLLMFFFYIATFNLYLILSSDFAGRSKLYIGLLYILSSILYILALFSKEMALTLPLVVYFYDLLKKKEGGRGWRSLLPNSFNVGYIIITSVYLYFRFFYFKNPHDILAVRKASEILFTVPYIFLTNLKLILFPVALSADYVLVFKGGLLFIFLSLPIVALLFIAAFVQKNKGIAFGFLFFAITLLPVCGIINLPHPLAERYLYLPTGGLSIVAGLTIHHIYIEHISKPKAVALIGMFLALMGTYASGVIIRNKVWKNGYSLWSDTIKKSPNSYRAHNGLGLFYLRSGKITEAIKHFEAALRLKTDYPEAQHNLGFAYAQKGMFDLAILHYQAALKIEPGNATYHNNLGISYAEQGRLYEAIQEFETSLNLKPDYPDAHYNLGLAYTEKNRLDEAILEFKTLLQLKPGYPDAHFHLGNIYAGIENFDEAIEEFKKALKYDPQFIEARYNLGVAYLKKGLQDKAKEEFEIVQRSKPGLSQ